jgi:hypothetical protein
MHKIIKFINTSSYPDLLQPVPASQVVPGWYKDMESYFHEEKDKPTIKKCMPVFDSITAGYLILLPQDINVKIINGVQTFESKDFDLILSHSIEQARSHPYANGQDYPKLKNYWSIQTPPGYSIEVVNPNHRESVFTILPGIVDTDNYIFPINFPMVINDLKFEGVIPKGTPIAQILPFKRDEWTMEVATKEEFAKSISDKIDKHSKLFKNYKKSYRNIKKYR